METKELRIQVPEGYEIDKENSTFECVKFKKKHLNFFEIRDSYDTETMTIIVPYNSNNYQKKLNAINKLIFVAKYLMMVGFLILVLKMALISIVSIFIKIKYKLNVYQLYAHI